MSTGAAHDLGGERTLVARARAGDREALGALLSQYERRVFGLIRRLVWREAEAMELTQETFIVAIQHAARLDPDRSFRAWLFRVAVNLCRNHKRLFARGEIPTDAADGRAPLWGAPATDPEQAAAAAERTQRLARALETLEPQTRALVLLRVHEELSYAELRQIFGVPAVVLKMRVHRALGRLRRLAEEWPS
jgi:RNA polymerase sigma-70 factor (ECF subfamily)